MTTLAGRRAVQDVATVEWTRVSKATELVEAARQQVPAIEVGGLVRGMPDVPGPREGRVASQQRHALSVGER
jgi:hypothetical protein